MRLCLICLCIIIVIMLILSFIIAYNVAHPKTFTHKEIYDMEKGLNQVFDFDAYQKKDICISSFDHYKIHGYFIRNKSNKYIIFTHGYTSNRYQSMKYLDIFYKQGYNCIIYDDRGHGANKKTICTMGYLESKDLIAVIDYVYKTYGENIYLGLHGESMGGGIEIAALKYKPKVKFIVDDCGYGKLKNVLQDQTKKLIHLPHIFVDIAGLLSSIFFGYNFAKFRPIDYLYENEIPVCFIHGDFDSFTNKWQSEEMYEATKGYKELHLFKEADHAQSFTSDQNLYRKIINNFLNTIEEREN